MHSKLAYLPLLFVGLYLPLCVNAQDKEKEQPTNIVYVVEESKFKDPPSSGSPAKYKKMTVDELTTHHFGLSASVAYSEAYFRGAKRSAVFNAKINYPPTEGQREAMERELRRLLPEEKKEVADSRAELKRRFEEFKKVATPLDVMFTQNDARLNRMNLIIDELWDHQLDLLSIRNITDLREKIEFILTRLQEFDRTRKDYQQVITKDWLVYSVRPETLYSFQLWEDYDAFEHFPEAPQIDLHAVSAHYFTDELASLMSAQVEGQKIRLAGDIEGERRRIISLIDTFKYDDDPKNLPEFRHVLIQTVLMMGIWSSNYFLALEKYLKPDFEVGIKELMLASLDQFEPANEQEEQDLLSAKEMYANLTDAEWKQFADNLWNLSMVEGPLSGLFHLPLTEQIEESSILGRANSSIHSKVQERLNERLLNTDISTLKAEMERARRENLPAAAAVLVLASMIQLTDEILLLYEGKLPTRIDHPQLAELRERCFEIFDAGLQILIDQKSELSPELVSAMSSAATLFSRFPQGENRRSALLEVTSMALNPQAQVSSPSFVLFREFGIEHSKQLQKRLRGE